MAEVPAVYIVNKLVEEIHGRSVDAGWWTDPKTGQKSAVDAGVFCTKLALIHAELSEALEGFRKNLNDDHLPHRKMVEVEFADAFIRLADLAGAMNMDLGGATAEKLEYNAKRADHKIEARQSENGKKF